ncbi:MAG TPA: cytochrome P460 family protein [Steroidobacteraceae bacterium]|jgi:cytochrome c553|nr:cytochrome P460 family protein [Steroidobacteraceae bacterium]
MKILRALTLLALLTTLASAADLEQGRAKSLGCQACHGANGVGTAPDIPNLAGQKAGYLAAQLTAFRASTRKHQLMNAIAAQLADADIENLAAFWSSLPAGPGAVTDAAADPAAEFRKSRMVFPVSFPKDFVLYSESFDDSRKSTQRSYVNHLGLNATRAGQKLPPGSIIVVENGPANQPASYAAMETEQGWGAQLPEILRNGDWSYALFDERRALRADFNYARCLACHKPQSASSYVFGLEAIAAVK